MQTQDFYRHWLTVSPKWGAASQRIVLKAVREKGLVLGDVLESEQLFLEAVEELGQGKYKEATWAELQKTRETAETEYDKLFDKRIRVLGTDSEEYPQLLLNRLEKEAAPLLYVLGEVSLLQTPCVAVVGARLAGSDALELAKNMAEVAVQEGTTVVSGMAKGIDAAAHLGALEAGGSTVGVLAEGLLSYALPKELRDALDGGQLALVSEFPPDDVWRASNAMRRNRTIVALSEKAVAIVSGPQKDASGRGSGTFQAGLYALELGVPLYVADPDLFRDTPAGNVALIQKGGVPFRQPSDVFAFTPQTNKLKSSSSSALTLF